MKLNNILTGIMIIAMAVILTLISIPTRNYEALNINTAYAGEVKAGYPVIVIDTEPEIEEETFYYDVPIEHSFIATAYCSCSKCCGKWAGGNTASGTVPTAGRTIAVDKNVIPLGTVVLIDGKEYVAEDTGSAIKGNRVDIYFSNHQDALNFGRREVTVSWEYQSVCSQ